MKNHQANLKTQLICIFKYNIVKISFKYAVLINVIQYFSAKQSSLGKVNEPIDDKYSSKSNLPNSYNYSLNQELDDNKLVLLELFSLNTTGKFYNI